MTGLEKDLAQYAPMLLSVLGGAFQWVRQWRHINEAWTYVYAVALALVVYGLTYDFSVHVGTQLAIIKGILWVGGNFSTVLGGTFIASGAAKAGLAVVPMTNSK